MKAPERTPVREDGFTTENAADGTFQHPGKHHPQLSFDLSAFACPKIGPFSWGHDANTMTLIQGKVF